MQKANANLTINGKTTKAKSSVQKWFDKLLEAKKANDPKRIRHAETKMDEAQNKVGECTLAYAVIETVLTLIDYKIIVDDDGVAVDITEE